MAYAHIFQFKQTFLFFLWNIAINVPGYCYFLGYSAYSHYCFLLPMEIQADVAWFSGTLLLFPWDIVFFYGILFLLFAFSSSSGYCLIQRDLAILSTGYCWDIGFLLWNIVYFPYFFLLLTDIQADIAPFYRILLFFLWDIASNISR